MNRSFRLPVALFAAVAVFGTVGLPAGSAVAKGTAATPSPSPSASPSPAPTQEPLEIAIPRLEAKLKTDPNDKETQVQLAQAYYSSNRPDLAQALTAKLIAGGTKTAQIYYLDGVSNAALGNAPAAIGDLENASNLEPTNVAVLGALTSLYLRGNRPADAERVAKRAITFNKDDEEAVITYGSVLAAEKKFDDARVQFEAAAKLNPKDARPVVIEARTYTAQNTTALASQLYDRAMTIDPTSQDAIIGKAQILVSQHDVKGAVALYNSLLPLQTTPEDKATVVDEVAHTYALEKQNSDADAAYRKAIADYPKVPQTHLQYGDYLAFIHDMNGAEREWIAAAGPNRDYADALARLGDYYTSKHDAGRALAQYQRLTEIAPNDPRAYLMYGTGLSVAHQYDKARVAFSRSYSLAKTPESVLGWAAADFQLHNYPECAKIYAAVDKNAPQITRQNPQLLFLMGQCYQKSGDKQNARTAYVRFEPYLKPGSQALSQVKSIVADLDHPAKTAAKPKPAATATPKH